MLKFEDWTAEDVIAQAKTDCRWVDNPRSMWFDVCIIPVLTSMAPEMAWWKRLDWIDNNKKELKKIAFGPLDN